MLEILEFIFQDFAHWLSALAFVCALSFFRLVEIDVDRRTYINGQEVVKEEVEQDDD